MEIDVSGSTNMIVENGYVFNMWHLHIIIFSFHPQDEEVEQQYQEEVRRNC